MSDTAFMTAVHIVVRRPWADAALVILVGPGGAGKSSLGSLLAPLLGRRLIDLDREFQNRIGAIDDYIRDAGYAAYKAANSGLAASLVSDVTEPTLLVTSSGFLALDNPPEILASNRKLIERGYCVSLLPADDIDVACEIIVARQLARGLSRDAQRERQMFRARFPIYRSAGDILVVSAAPSSEIATTLAARLSSQP